MKHTVGLWKQLWIILMLQGQDSARRRLSLGLGVSGLCVIMWLALARAPSIRYHIEHQMQGQGIQGEGGDL